MAGTTAIAYFVMLVLTPLPNVALLSYINKKPLLNKVTIDYHHKDMIVINWMMSLILLIFMIYTNVPGYTESHDEGVRVVADLMIRKIVGIFIIALMNSCLISAALQYLQTFYWSWMCEQEDDNLKHYVRAFNFLLTFFVWVAWMLGPEKLIITSSLKIGIVQMYSIIAVLITIIIHVIKSIRKYKQKSSLKTTYNHVDPTNSSSAFNLVTIAIVCTLMTLIILMFTVFPERPKSMFSVAFTFNFTQSLGCPTILIIGNKRIQSSIGRLITVKLNTHYEYVKSSFNQKFRRNQVYPTLST